MNKSKVNANYNFDYPQDTKLFSVTSKVDCDNRGVPIGLNSDIRQHFNTITEVLDAVLRDLGYVKLKPAQKIYSCLAANCDTHENFTRCEGCMNQNSWRFI